MRTCGIRQSLLLAFLFLAICLASPAQEPTYIGSETCTGCHDEQSTWMKGSVHEKAIVPSKGTEAVSGCESCHGPGSAHIEDLTPATIRTFKTEAAGERSGACLACHSSSDAKLNFRRSDHDRRRVACDQCHTTAGS